MNLQHFKNVSMKTVAFCTFWATLYMYVVVIYVNRAATNNRMPQLD